MKKSQRKVRSLVLKNYLGTAIVTFLVFIFLFVMFGFDMEDQIFDTQVEAEADRLMEQVSWSGEVTGQSRALPMTWYVGTTGMPEWMKAAIRPDWQDGQHEIFGEEQGHFHLAVRTLEDGQKLYLLFNARPYVRSTNQIYALVIAVLIVGSVIALISALSLSRLSRKLTQPLEDIAQKLSTGEEVDFGNDYPDVSVKELKALLAALAARDARIKSLIQRETEFNRDVSHELRTPLTVAVGALEVMDIEGKPSPAVNRLKTSVIEMQALTEGILWLGREPDLRQQCDLSAIYEAVMASHQHLLEGKGVTVRLDGGVALMPVPDPVAMVIVGNLMRNAFAYTHEGEILVQIEERKLTIADTGVGIGNASKEEGGFGVGLPLVERLCAHFGLELEVRQRASGGTSAIVSW